MSAAEGPKSRAIDADAEESPPLRKEEQEDSVRRSAPRAAVLHEAIILEGIDELSRTSSALFWSGLAAGLSMGFSLVGQGLLSAYLPSAEWTPLLTSFGYSLGFVIVVLGRQQLFTENTLTPVLPLLDQRDSETLRRMLRLWAIVLVGNLVGAAVFALMVAKLGVFAPDVRQAFDSFARQAASPSAELTFLKAIFAGWLIALMVWLLPSAESNRLHVVILMSYIVGLGGFSHVIAGSLEVMYGTFRGVVPWHEILISFLWPALAGNIIGGVALVTAVNHGQVTSGQSESPEQADLS